MTSQQVRVTQADREAYNCLMQDEHYDHEPAGAWHFARHRQAAEAEAKAREAEMVAMTTDDPEWICAGIPDFVIEAGMDARDRVDHDLNNYVSGITPDWDDGMICAAIFKAMLRAALTRAGAA